MSQQPTIQCWHAGPPFDTAQSHIVAAAWHLASALESLVECGAQLPLACETVAMREHTVLLLVEVLRRHGTMKFADLPPWIQEAMRQAPLRRAE